MQRWNALSRAMKWAVLAILGLGIYFGVVEPTMKWTRDLNFEAGRSAERLTELKSQAETRSEATATLRRSARLFGDVQPPGPLDERVSAASQRINRILSENGAGSVDFSSRTPVSLGRRVLSDFIEDTEKQEIQRVAFDVSFTGTPEQVATIVSALEQVPEITLIGDINLDRIDARGARLVSASLSPEVWGIARKGGRQ